MSLRYSIVFHPTAQVDLDEIIKYIAKENAAAAVQMLDEINNKILQLEQAPERGEIPKNKIMVKMGYRLLNMKNYVVLYMVKENRVEILRIIHGWRKWEKLVIVPKEGFLSLPEVMEQIRKKIFHPHQ